MKLTAVEQETILNFNEGEDTASLYTYNVKLQNRFNKVAAEYPKLVSRKDNGHGAVTYDFPKGMLTVSIRKPLSEAEKKRRSDILTEYRYTPKPQ